MIEPGMFGKLLGGLLGGVLGYFLGNAIWAFVLANVGAVLGHSHLNVSEIYAEKNLELAFEVARRIG